MNPKSPPPTSQKSLQDRWQVFADRKIRSHWAGTIVVAILCVIAATIARLLFGLVIGTNLTFVLYFPAVLLAALTAGVMSGVAAIILSIVASWWAFLPPNFAFGVPRAVDYANFVAFTISSSLTIWLAERYRRLIANYRKQADELVAARPKVADLHRTTALFEAVINMTPDLVFVKDLESRALLRNPAALLGKTWDDIKGREEAEWHQNSAEARQVVANDRKVIESGTSMQFVEQFTTLQGERTLLSTKSPLFDEHGKIVGIIGVSTDITERENRAKHADFIMRELSHRSKNLMMIIQAITRQSIRQASSLEEFETQFNERLASLARLHDLLVQEEWRGASLRAIAQTQTGPFAGGRVIVDGPEILLRPDSAQVLSMVFHELATNASKYGALSNATGTIQISWGFVGDQRTRIFVRWQEIDGPAVLAPQRKGFGTVVLERMALQIPDASASLKFLAPGVVWYLEAPAESLIDHPDKKEGPLP